ncbi:FAD-dependent oxidoreductase [Desulfoplanes sp.]
MNPVRSRTLFGYWNGTRYGGENMESLPAETQSILLELCEMSRGVPGRKMNCLAGWKGFFLIGPNADPVDMARAYACRIQETSCGKCLPCRTGTRIIADLLTRICDGYGREQDLTAIERMIDVVRAGSMCEVGHQSIVTVRELISEFRDRFLDAVVNPVRRDRGKYDFKVTAPCIEACPVHLDVPRYIEFIRSARYAQALAVIREHNPLPAVCGRVCVRFCEQACRRGISDNPVDIKHLKQFVSDVELEAAVRPGPVPCDVSPRAGHVAIVGSGPAGIMAAYVLLQRGYGVTLFESMEEPGGMAALGIPDYRLPRAILREEIRGVENMGATIRYSTALGRDVGLQELHDTFDAVFLGIGTQNGRPMGIPGEEEHPSGYILGVEFLRLINLGRPIRRGRKALVVGGGNVAMDCSRSALRLGFDGVHLVYRRDRSAMPADKVEIHEAEEEGVNYHFQVNPVRILCDHDGVKGVECVRMQPGKPDHKGRRRPEPVSGSEFVIPCDMVIPAIGQSMDMSWMEEACALKTTPWKTIQVDPLTMATSVPGIFAGGDCTSGPATLVEALAAGERAARAMDQHIRGVPHAMEWDEQLRYFYNLLARLDQDVVDRPARGFDRMKMRERKVCERIRDFDQVEEAIPPEDALLEADRCLRCYRIVMIGREEERAHE